MRVKFWKRRSFVKDFNDLSLLCVGIRHKLYVIRLLRQLSQFRVVLFGGMNSQILDFICQNLLLLALGAKLWKSKEGVLFKRNKNIITLPK